MQNIPLVIQFIATILIIIGAIEAGHLAGRALQVHLKNEKDGMISVISGSILGLLSFILAFTFGSVSDRYNSRKALIRDEANQIGTTWLRTDFMAEPERSASRKLLKEYLDLRVGLIKSSTKKDIERSLIASEKIQKQLWLLAGRRVQRDMQTDLGALYFDGLNKLIEIQGLRVAIAYRGQIPAGLWISLYVLLICAMLSIGYYSAIIQSKRNFASLVLAFSFSLVIGIISTLDRLETGYFTISQQPLIDLQTKIENE